MASENAPLLKERWAASIQLDDLDDTPTEGSHHGVAFLKAGENLSSVYTLCAMSLGVGVFVLPSVLKDMGLLAGLVAIGFFGLWANWMQLVLIKSANKFSPPIYSYEELAKKVLGWPGQFMLAFFTAVTTFLGNAAHMKTVVGILQDLLEYFVTGKYDENGKVFTKEKEVILYVFLLVIGLIKTADPEISSMRFISTASVMVVLTICLWTTGECMFWYWPHGNHEFTGHEAVHYVSDDWHVYAADLPAVAFAFSGTFCLFPVYKEMNDKTYPNVRKVVGYSTIVCCLGYGVVSVVGVLTFGNNVDVDAMLPGNTTSNYLYVFPTDHYVVTILSFCLVFTITLLYAVINFPFLNAVEQMANVVGKLINPRYSSTFLRRPQGRLIVTVIGMVGVVAINLAFDSLKVLFGFCGGWGITFVVYFVPSCIALGLSKDEPLAYRMLLVASLAGVIIIAAAFTYVTFIYHPPASSTNKTLGYYDANAPPEFGPMHGI